MIPQHSSATNEHYTPAHVVEAARATLGGIDLDPASCAEANETVKAVEWIGLPRDGLACDWQGRVFLNPPGGRVPPKRHGTRSSAVAWWRKLTEEVAYGHTSAAVFVGFTLEILRSAQGGPWPHPLDFSVCIPRERLKFGGDQPTHANVLVYLGPNPGAFERHFSPIGLVRL